jgi:hypothetical protein
MLLIDITMTITIYITLLIISISWDMGPIYYGELYPSWRISVIEHGDSHMEGLEFHMIQQRTIGAHPATAT